VNEPLDRLLVAYRAEPVDDGAARVTRARVLASHAQHARARPLRAFGWFAGALLCGSSAMAAVTNGSEIVAHVSALLAGHSPASQTRAAGPALTSAPPSPPHPHTPALAAQPHTPELAVEPASRATVPDRSTHDAAPRVAHDARRRPLARASQRPGADGDADLATFERAHRLHFAGSDWRAAIAAWSTYLARFPHGRFALEARYNLAIAYLRDGDVDAARTALHPFATGEHGSYRRREARALLRALREGGLDASRVSGR